LDIHDKKNKKISSATSDPWMRRFVNGVCDVFGVPASTAECSNSSDRLLFSWAMLHMAQAINANSELLNELQDSDPSDASEAFVRRIYDETGELVIPCIPHQASSGSFGSLR